VHFGIAAPLVQQPRGLHGLAAENVHRRGNQEDFDLLRNGLARLDPRLGSSGDAGHGDLGGRIHDTLP
jgi:hypothetical protein